MVELVTLRQRRPCPICKKPSTQKHHPFCSGRCTQVDLNRWLGGQYAIPVEEDEQQLPEDETEK
jgi:endogenous inhibitor of DNA gyrase (YacG/DUF329 family)